jgi:hypothetical protein
LEMTSLAFMLDWVPEPVCQTTRGKWSTSLSEATSSAACWIALPSLGSTDPAHQRSCPDFFRKSCSLSQPTKSVLHVDGRGGALEDTKGPDDGRLHAVLRLVDFEVAQRALGLATPVLAGVDLELAESIALGSSVGGHGASGCECAGGVQGDGGELLLDEGGTVGRANR